MGQVVAQVVIVEQVGELQAGAGEFVGVGGADAAPGGALDEVAAPVFLGGVGGDVIRHDDVGALGDEEAPFKLDAGHALLQGFHFIEKGVGIDGGAGTEQIDGVIAQDARRDEVEAEVAGVGNHGVTGVVAALIADD